jgi:hypothetical protein
VKVADHILDIRLERILIVIDTCSHAIRGGFQTAEEVEWGLLIAWRRMVHKSGSGVELKGFVDVLQVAKSDSVVEWHASQTIEDFRGVKQELFVYSVEV